VEADLGEVILVRSWVKSGTAAAIGNYQVFWFTAREARREGDFGFVDLRGLI
jgi:hypothetical protein